MKYIQRKSSVTLDEITGNIVDTLNVEDKIKNAPSINLLQQMAGIPTEGIIAYETEDGTIPEGYEEVDSSLISSGVEEGTIVEWEDGVEIPEGWEVLETSIPTPDFSKRTKVTLEPSAPYTVDEDAFFQVVGELGTSSGSEISIQADGKLLYYAWGQQNATNTAPATPLKKGTVVTVYSLVNATINFFKIPVLKKKQIKKVAVTPITSITGSIVDGTNIDNKATNTYSANTIDGLLSLLREKNIITVTTTTEQKLTANATREKMILNAVYSKIGNKLSLDVKNNEIVIGEGVNTIKISGQVLFSKATSGYTHDLRIFKTGDVSLGVNIVNSALGGSYCVSPIITPIVVGGLKAGDVIYARVVGAKDDTVAASAPATYITVEVIN